ncbi:MAG: ABC transporter permease [Christensenellales bacterium]
MQKALRSIKYFLFDNIMIVVCFGFLVISTILSPAFLSVENLFSILRQMSMVGMMAIGQSVAIITGGIDASQGGLLSASVVVLALSQNFPLPVVLLIVIAFGFVYGSISGSIVSQFKIAPFIITMGMGTMGDGLALLLTQGRPIFLVNNKEFFTQTMGSGNVLGIPALVVFFVVIAVLAQLLLSRTSLGLHWRSLGGNEEAAYWSGVSTKKYKILGYAFSGAMVGLAAIVAVSRTGVADPVVGSGISLNSMSAAVLGGTYLGGGGRGSALGAILGVFILGLINNVFNLLNVSTYYQYIAKGAIIIFAIILGSRTIKKT